jgi:GTP-binding protein
MPGYGPASRAEWGSLVLQYLKERQSLRRVYLLIDTQRKVRQRDQQLIGMLTELEVPYSLVLTKFDAFPGELKPFIGTVVQNMERWIQDNGGPCCWPSVITTSAKSGQGLSALRSDILEKCGLPKS